MRKRAPLYGLVFKGAADIGNIFGLKIIDLFMRYLGQRGFTCHVKWHKPFLLGLIEHGGYQTVVLYYRLCREPGARALVLPGL